MHNFISDRNIYTLVNREKKKAHLYIDDQEGSSKESCGFLISEELT